MFPSSSDRHSQDVESDDSSQCHGGARPKVKGCPSQGCCSSLDQREKFGDAVEDEPIRSQENGKVDEFWKIHENSILNTFGDGFGASRSCSDPEEWKNIESQSNLDDLSKGHFKDSGEKSQDRMLTRSCQEASRGYPLHVWPSGKSSSFHNHLYCSMFEPVARSRGRCPLQRGSRQKIWPPHIPGMCKSQSLMLSKQSGAGISVPQANHISLLDEMDEQQALQRWRNAGLALRRVLTSKATSKDADHEPPEGDPSVECQNVVDGIFKDDNDDEHVPNSFRGHDSYRNFSLIPQSEIWGSQLYPVSLTSQCEVSPESCDTVVEDDNQESSLFPWKHGATLLGACLFPQCIGLMRQEKAKSKSGESPLECNNRQLKHTCDNEIVNHCNRTCAMNNDSSDVGEKSPCNTVEQFCDKVEDSMPNHVVGFEKDWSSVCEQSSCEVLESGDQNRSVSPLDAKLNGLGLSSVGEAVDVDQKDLVNGCHGNKGDYSDVTDYSSVYDCSGDVYFGEDNDKHDSIVIPSTDLAKSSNPFKKTLQRERKKKLVHARKTHKRKSSSSSSDVVVDDGCNNEDTMDNGDLGPYFLGSFNSSKESCPSFLTNDLDCSQPGRISPPRRSLSVARHFLDKSNRSRGYHPPTLSNGMFRSRDSQNSDLSTLPDLEFSPLESIPSFLESWHSRASQVYDPIEPDNSVGVGDAPESRSTNEELPQHPEDQLVYLNRKRTESSERGDNQFLGSSCLSEDVETVHDAGHDSLAYGRGENSLLSPDSWIRLIDEIYQPIVGESDAGEESALSDMEMDKQDETPDFFRCPDTPDKNSDSGDADDEFECECEHCMLLRSLDRPSHFLSAIGSSGDNGPRESSDSLGREQPPGEPWDTDWAPNGDENFELEPFLLSLQDVPQDPVDLMFQNVITQMLAVHPELLGEQAPPPVPQTMIDQLPSRTANSKNIEEELTCPVCLCHFELGEVMTVLSCKHLYHPLCIQAWLAKSGTCPVCRRSLHAENGHSGGQRDD